MVSMIVHQYEPNLPAVVESGNPSFNRYQIHSLLEFGNIVLILLTNKVEYELNNSI